MVPLAIELGPIIEIQQAVDVPRWGIAPLVEFPNRDEKRPVTVPTEVTGPVNVNDAAIARHRSWATRWRGSVEVIQAARVTGTFRE
jgi:hypothetical protein